MVAVCGLRDRLGEATGRRFDVVVTTFDAEPAQLDAYRRRLDVDAVLVADRSRELYRALGAERGSVWRVWSWDTLRGYARLLRRPGRRGRLGRPQGDTLQLGADVVVDAEGAIADLWLPGHPDDRPPMSEIDRAMRRSLSRR